MSFSENLQYIRKQNNITQEELAEKLDVSRQSVSKWESGTTFPEMEKLLQICQMFRCDMNHLIQGDVRQLYADDKCGYDQFYNGYSKLITAGICMITGSLGIMSFLQGIGVLEPYNYLPSLVLFFAAVMILIIMRLQNKEFVRRNSVIEDFYTTAEKDTAFKKFTIKIVTGVGILLFAFVLSVCLEELETGADEILGGIFILLATAGIGILTYGVTQKNKYNIDKYNRNRNQELQSRKDTVLIGKLCICILLAATIVWIAVGFLFGAWHQAALIYIIGGIICVMVRILLSSFKKNDK